ncbi:MAG: metal-sensing transcriptional repressor [Prochlorothrix sp.]|nr:metal-sensitive transcriptional regulator [Prochlorothrix sp.]
MTTSPSQSTPTDPPAALDVEHSHGSDHSHGPDHKHDPQSQKRIINRLSRVEGHIRGIKTMVEEDRACPEVLIQIAAVRGALDKVARLILEEHLTDCVARAANAGDIEEELSDLKKALDQLL